jgi:hypothetical protein
MNKGGIKMNYKAGDLVVCVAPVGNLIADKIYKVINIVTPTRNTESQNTQVFVENDPIGYFSFRFTLSESQSDNSPTVVANDPWADELPPWDEKEEPVVIKAPGAAKNDQDKIDLSLIPRISNIEHAKAFMVGQKKYGRYNYCKGHNASQLVAAAKRHLDAWFDGEEADPVDGQHHLGSVMACCSMILRQRELGTLKDDRYKPEITEV